MKAILHLCRSYGLNETNYPDIGENFVDNSIFDIIKFLAPTLNDTISSCKWHNRDGDYQTLFRPVLTYSGLCFTFNALNSRDIYTNEYVP